MNKHQIFYPISFRNFKDFIDRLSTIYLIVLGIVILGILYLIFFTTQYISFIIAMIAWWGISILITLVSYLVSGRKPLESLPDKGFRLISTNEDSCILRYEFAIF